MTRKLMVILLIGAMCLSVISSALAAQYNEAPMLRTKVAAGELPPVQERISEEPLVVKPIDEIGQYGGTLRVNGAGLWAVFGFLDLGLYAIAQDFSKGTIDYYTGLSEKKFVPRLAKGGELSKDRKTFTLYFRKGVRWSDGTPLTADDFLFWWEDIVLNKELTPALRDDFKPGGEVMKVEKVDEYTVRLLSSKAFKLPEFLFVACKRGGWAYGLRPKHYLSQFHIKYDPKADELAKKEGFDNWWNLFMSKLDRYHNPDLPTYMAWKTVESKPERWVGERNPYFWNVDTAGNQLPYIDRIVVELSPNKEVRNMKIIGGQVDYADAYLSFEDIPIYKAREEEGNYRLVNVDMPAGGMPTLTFNQTYGQDPVLAEILRDVRFRQALSLAINREEANQVAYFGLSYPTQVTCLPGSKFLEPEFAEAYTEYSPERANRLLDEMGLEWDKKREWRLRPDGKTLAVVTEGMDSGSVRSYGLVVPLIKEYWEKVGVKTVVKTMDRSLWTARFNAGEQQIFVLSLEGVDDLSFELNPSYMLAPMPGQGLPFAKPWNLWLITQGESGEEPPEEVKKLAELWDELKVAENEKEIVRLGKEILRIHSDNLWHIGVVGTVKQPVVLGNSVKNFPDSMPLGWSGSNTWVTSFFWPFQWFLKR